MDLADDAQRPRWQRQLDNLFRDRWVVTGMLPLAAFTAWTDLLEEVDARRPLVIATGLGAGPCRRDGGPQRGRPRPRPPQDLPLTP
ncbi:MAG: hypothetical protein H0V42_09025 [Nocardioidaceae bacterium]|nr:hypothetical protein [Nocardioidaceae bacterium]